MISWGSNPALSTNYTPQQDILQIVVVFPTSGLEGEEQSTITKTNDALNQLEITFSNQVNFTRIYPTTIGKGGGIIIAQFSKGFDLIIAVAGNLPGNAVVGGEYGEALGIGAGQNPNQNMLLINGVIQGNNDHGRSIFYLEHEGAFLAGALAAMVSNTSKLGFYGTERNDIINRYKFGFRQGANFIGDLTNIQYQFLETYADTVDGYNASLSQLNQGVDIIFTVSGQSNLEVFNAIEDYNENRTEKLENEITYAIGSNDDQDFIKPGLILTSMVKRIELQLAEEITNFIDGNWVKGTLFLGVAGDHVGLTDMSFTQDEKNTKESIFNDQTRDELLQYLEIAIINEEIIVSEDTSNTEIKLEGDNPFVKADQSNLFIDSNGLLLGALVVTSTVAIALIISRGRILRFARKSGKSKAVDYLDQAKKIAEEPDE